MIFRGGAQPDGETFAEKTVIGGGFRDDASAGRQNERGRGAQNLVKTLSFQTAETALTVQVENYAETQAAALFYQAIEFNERNGEVFCQQATQRGFSGAAQTYDGDTLAASGGIAVAELSQKNFAGALKFARGKLFQKFHGALQFVWRLRSVVEKFVNREIEGFHDLPKEQDGNVAMAAFELGQVAFGDLRIAGEDSAAHTAAGAGFADAAAEELEVGDGVGAVVGCGFGDG